MQPRQVVQNIGAVVAQVANRIISVVRVVESADAQARQSVQIQHLLEISNFVCSQIYRAQADQAVEANPNLLDVVSSEVKDF